MKFFYKIVFALLLVLVFGMLVILNFEKKKEETILDYYKTLPKSFFFDKELGDIKYPLYQKKGIWISKSIANYELFPVVDLKRGYIEINDEGTGGGSVSIKLFLFRKSNGAPVIAITKGGFDGFYFDSSSQFYEMQNKKWVKATGVFPKLNISQFLAKKGQDLYFQNSPLVKNNLTLLIQLSGNENIAIVKPNFNKYDYLITSNQNRYFDKPFTETERNKILKIIKSISIESFQLKFNKKLGKFEIKDSILVRRKNTNDKLSEEDIIFNKLSKLKVVKELALYIDSSSQKKRSLELIFDGEAQDNSNYITVKAVEDNGANFVTHLIFQVQKDNLEISLYNPIKDKYEKVKQ